MWRVFALACLHEAAASASKEVVALRSATFHETVQPSDLWLLKFYAPWCGHCKRLAPVLDEVAAEAEGDISFGKVDCTIYEQLCSSFSVKGFPTLIVVQGKDRWVYKGARKKKDLLALAARMQLPAVGQLKAASDLDPLYSTAPVVFMQGRDPAAADADDAVAAFDVAARKLMHTDVFVASAEPEVLRQVMVGAGAADAAVPPTPFVVRLEKGEAPRLLTEPATTEAVEAFVGVQRVPSFSLVDDANFGSLMNAGRPLALLLLDPATLPPPSTPSSSAATTATRTLVMDDSLSGVGAALRGLSREPALREQFVFAMLDGADFADYLQATYYVERDTLPRMVVLWKGERFGTRSFYTDVPGEAAGGSASMRRFLERVHSGAEVGEFEGKPGMPARWWRSLCARLPPLRLLDLLPRGTFVGAFALGALYLLVKIITYVPYDEYYDKDEGERQAARRPKKAVKAE